MTLKTGRKEHPGTMDGWNTINLPPYQNIPKLFQLFNHMSTLKRRTMLWKIVLYGKWSGCRSCYVGLLLGGNCGLLSHSGCTQKIQQNEQCLPPQCCTRREEIHPKKPLRPRSQWFTRGKHGTGGNQLCLGHTCKTKKLCALQSSWMRQQPAPVPSNCPSAEANTQERCPAALCHCKTPSLDEVRC